MGSNMISFSGDKEKGFDTFIRLSAGEQPILIEIDPLNETEYVAQNVSLKIDGREFNLKQQGNKIFIDPSEIKLFPAVYKFELAIEGQTILQGFIEWQN